MDQNVWSKNATYYQVMHAANPAYWYVTVNVNTNFGGVNAYPNTGWGMATAKATADSEMLTQPSSEFAAGPDGLRQLPASAMIISYAAPGGRQHAEHVGQGLSFLLGARGEPLQVGRVVPAVAGGRPDGRPDLAGLLPAGEGGLADAKRGGGVFRTEQLSHVRM